MTWKAFEIVNDRLRRWYIADVTPDSGRGKPIIATYFRKKEHAQVAAASQELLDALECEIALDSLYDVGQAVFEKHGYVKGQDGQAMQWVRKKSIAAIAKAKGE